MKSLRLLVLMIFAVGLIQVHAQQEIDPDHFDQPASRVSAHSAEHGGHSTAQNRHKRNVNLASKHAGTRAHHYHAHTSA